jgi:hypothetical protein
MFVLTRVLRSDEKDDVYGITDAEGLGYVGGAALP